MKKNNLNSKIGKGVITLALSTLAMHTSANSARTFLEASHLNGSDFSASTLSALHFFADQDAGGTFDEFGFLNTDSSIGVDYINSDEFDSHTVYGELFIDKFIVSASFTSAEIDFLDTSTDATQLALGYLVNDNLIVRYRHTDFDDESIGEFVVEYNHQLNDNDYIGFSASVDDEFDVFTLSSSYYAHLDAGRFIRLGLDYEKTPEDDAIAVNARYYFSSSNSVGTSVAEDEYSLAYQHYFSFNFGLEASYLSLDEEDAVSVSIVGQF